MTAAPSIVTWLIKDSGTFRELPNGSFRRIGDAPATFTGPVTLRAQPAKQAAEGAPKGNSGDRRAGDSLPYAKGSPTSEAASVSHASHAAAQQARVLAYLQSCRFDGSTDLAGEEALGLDGSSYRPRRIRLCELGLVVLTDEKRLTPSGKMAGVYVAREFAPPVVKQSLTAAQPAPACAPIQAIPAPVKASAAPAVPVPAKGQESQAELF